MTRLAAIVLVLSGCVVNRGALAPVETYDGGKPARARHQGDRLSGVVQIKPGARDAAAPVDAGEPDAAVDAAPERDAQPPLEPDAGDAGDHHLNLAPTAQPDYLLECGAMNDTGVYRYHRRVMNDQQFVGCSLKNAEIDQSVEWPQLDPRCHILDYTITESEATNATGTRLVVMQCMCTSGKCTEP